VAVLRGRRWRRDGYRAAAEAHATPPLDDDVRGSTRNLPYRPEAGLGVIPDPTLVPVRRATRTDDVRPPRDPWWVRGGRDRWSWTGADSRRRSSEGWVVPVAVTVGTVVAGEEGGELALER
jgi:hypothetical protein